MNFSLAHVDALHQQALKKTMMPVNFWRFKYKYNLVHVYIQ